MEDFRAAAEEFCAAVEDGVAAERVEPALARLYAAAFSLGEGEAMSLPDLVTPVEWQAVHDAVRARYGERERYWEVWQVAANEEPVLASLADDLADVYRDVRNGLRHLERGTAEGEVVWQWRLDFRAHWGRHAAAALRVLRELGR